jgi:hypothetical protein
MDLPATQLQSSCNSMMQLPSEKLWLLFKLLLDLLDPALLALSLARSYRMDSKKSIMMPLKLLQMNNWVTEEAAAVVA